MAGQRERREMLLTILSVGWADGDFHEREQRLFAELAETFQIENHEIAALHRDHAEAPSPERLAALLPDEEDRIFCYEEAVRMSYADGKLVDAEQQLLDQLRECLEIDAALAREIESEIAEDARG